MKRRWEAIMTFINEAEWDRGVRLLVGISLLAGGWGLGSGWLGNALIAVGALALITGIAGWCPAYTACGISTRK
jgi:DUF2892 family protein